MNKELPDIAMTDIPQFQLPLEWVGMSGIDLPLQIPESDTSGPAHAVVDVQVNLPVGSVKGMHMSRVYRMLNQVSDQEAITPTILKELLEQIISSHHDCNSDGAKIGLDCKLLIKRAALKTPDLAGWKAYPVRIEATLIDGVFALENTVTVEYSSTCPCSAALTRQLVAQSFEADFPEDAALTRENISAWLEQKATLATPHSQRSEAQVTVDATESASSLQLLPLIDQIEESLATPVQTGVKREDEQAFAALNGQNLMFIEDAARRIQSGLSGRFANVRTHVRHCESLHPHDAVASAV